MAGVHVQGVRHNNTQNPATTLFHQLIGFYAAPTTEDLAQIVWRSAGVFRRLLCNVIVNGVAASSTLTFRKNGANGNQAISIPATTTGIFEDATNEDTIVTGDAVNVSVVTGAGGTAIQIRVLAGSFHPSGTNGTVLRHSGGTVNDVNWASATRYNSIHGHPGWNATYANRETRMRMSGTIRDLYVFVTNNNRVTDVTAGLAKNGSTTALAVLIGAGLTGVFEDTTNTVSVIGTDTVALFATSGTGAQALTPGTFSVAFDHADGRFLIVEGGAHTSSAGAAVKYFYLAPDLIAPSHSVEAESQVRARLPMLLSDMSVKIIANSLTAASTIRLRKNGANGNQSVSIGAGLTGFFDDAGNRDTVGLADLLNWRMETGATGTSIEVGNMSVIAMELASGPLVKSRLVGAARKVGPSALAA